MVQNVVECSCNVTINILTKTKDMDVSLGGMVAAVYFTHNNIHEKIT